MTSRTTADMGVTFAKTACACVLYGSPSATLMLYTPSASMEKGQSMPSGDSHGRSNEKVMPPPKSKRARQPRRCRAAWQL